MGRWTQFTEDPHRLPEGFIRIAYDADTRVYTFRDGKGTLYKGAPGAEYGKLTPVSNKDSLDSTRPGAFASDQRQKPERLRIGSNSAPTTFRDILPSNCITSPSSSADNPTSPIQAPKFTNGSARVRFMEAARKTALPAMQGVVYNLRRSKMTASSSGYTTNGETEHLLRRGTSTLSRNTSQATTRSGLSVETRMSVNPRRN